MRTPYVQDLSELDIALIGVPFDGAVTNRPGARHGPREVRNMSTMMRSIHHVTKVNPYNLCRIGDAGDVPLTQIYDLEAVNREITAFYREVAANNVTPVSVGGDHSITYPIFRALASPDTPTGPPTLVRCGHDRRCSRSANVHTLPRRRTASKS